MDFTTFGLYGGPYFIGLFFGLIYAILFVDMKSFLKYTSKEISHVLFMVIGTLFIFSYSFFWSNLLTVSFISSLKTNYRFTLTLSIVCFTSSLYFFGFIKNNKVLFNSNSTNKYVYFFQGFRSFFFNFPFLLLSFNSILLSLYYFRSPTVVLMSFLGFFTSILFITFWEVSIKDIS